MPTRTISNAGGNWNAVGAWVEGAVPTAADDVVATATSGNVTINVASVCRSIDLTAYTATLTHNSFGLSVGDASGGALNFSGSWTYTRSSATASAISFVSTSNNGGTGWAITWGGKTFGSIAFNGNGGKWVLQDAYVAGSLTATTMTFTRTTLDTNGQSITVGQFVLSGTLARTLTMGSSVFTLGSTGAGWSCADTTNLTVTANTATARLTGAGAIWRSGVTAGTTNWNGLTVELTAASGIQTMDVRSGTTVGNLTRTGGAATSSELILNASMTITGTLTATGEASPNRLWVRTLATGTAVTLTVNGSVVSTHADWQDITAAGSADWDLSAETGGSGDCLGNTGITFTTSRDLYAVAQANLSNPVVWALTDGGAGGVDPPLPQDDVFFTALSGAGTYTVNYRRVGRDWDFTGFTRIGTSSISFSVYGSWNWGQPFNNTGLSNQITLAGRGSHTITCGGESFNGNLLLDAPGGTYTLQDAFSGGADILLLTKGTLDTNGQVLNNVGSVNLNPTGFGTRALDMAGSTITLGDSGNCWNLTDITGLTLNAAGSEIIIEVTSATARTFIGRTGVSNGTLTATWTSTGVINLLGSSTFEAIVLNPPGARTLTLGHGTTTTTTAWDVDGTAGNLLTINSSTGGSDTTVLAKAGGGTAVSTYVSLTDITASPASTWHASTGSVDNGNNDGWIFGTPYVGAAVLTGVGSLAAAGTFAGEPGEGGVGQQQIWMRRTPMRVG